MTEQMTVMTTGMAAGMTPTPAPVGLAIRAAFLLARAGARGQAEEQLLAFVRGPCREADLGEAVPLPGMSGLVSLACLAAMLDMPRVLRLLADRGVDLRRSDPRPDGSPWRTPRLTAACHGALSAYEVLRPLAEIDIMANEEVDQLTRLLDRMREELALVRLEHPRDGPEFVLAARTRLFNNLRNLASDVVGASVEGQKSDPAYQLYLRAANPWTMANLVSQLGFGYWVSQMPTDLFADLLDSGRMSELKGRVLSRIVSQAGQTVAISNPKKNAGVVTTTVVVLAGTASRRMHRCQVPLEFTC